MRVTLNGYVSADEDLWLYEWYGYSAFGPSTIRQALEDNPAEEELVLEINSYGGSVWAGFEMYSLLRSSNIPTRAEVQSLAASAASYVMLGCDEVWVSPVAEIMVHLPGTATDGDRNAHKDSIHLLDSVEQSILNAYELKCAGKTTRAELSRMMHNSTWLTAQEAFDVGLVDGILYHDEVDPRTVVNATGHGIRAIADALVGPDINKLRDNYYKAHPPQNVDNDWQAQAKKRMAIEKKRYQ